MNNIFNNMLTYDGFGFDFKNFNMVRNVLIENFITM